MPNKYPTPKQEFLKTPSNVEQHNRLIEMPSFNRTIEIAKSEYFRRLNAMGAEPVSPGAATGGAMLFQRMQGVEDFCSVLFNLGEAIQLPPAQVHSDNLEPQQKITPMPQKAK